MLIFRILKYLLFVIIYFLIITGCENPPSDPDEINKLSVMAFLTSNTTKQSIYLYKTSFLDEGDSAYFEDYFYDKANVSISDNEGRIIPFYYQKGDRFMYEKSRYINMEAININLNEKYLLKVESEYGIIEGETIFPGEFEIIAPVEGVMYLEEDGYLDEYFYLVDLKIKWTKSKDAYMYMIQSKIPYLVYGGQPSYHYQSFMSYDTALNPRIYVNYHNYDTTRNSEIIITAVDKNFYQHHFEQYNSVGVKGGFGYLGSGTVKSVKIKFKKGE